MVYSIVVKYVISLCSLLNKSTEMHMASDSAACKPKILLSTPPPSLVRGFNFFLCVNAFSIFKIVYNTKFYRVMVVNLLPHIIFLVLLKSLVSDNILSILLFQMDSLHTVSYNNQSVMQMNNANLKKCGNRL